MTESYIDRLYREAMPIMFNKNEIDVNFTEFGYSNLARIPVHCTSLGEHKIESVGFKSYPDCAIYVKDDLWSIPHSLILLQSELYVYEIDTKLLYSLYLKNRMEFDSICLLFYENSKPMKFYKNEKPFYAADSRYITAYIDTLKVNYIKP